MTLRKLEVFYWVAEKLNMTTVSKERYLSQPAISQMIKEMEEELGVKLFNRLGKRLYLTDEGDILRKYARRMLNIYEEAKETLEENKDLKKGKLRLGASSTIGIYVIPQIIKGFMKEFPDIEISIKIGNTEDIVKLIVKNEVDFAFVEAEVDDDEIRSEEVWTDELILVTYPQHRWGDRKNVEKEFVEDEKFILREEGSGTKKVFEAAMRNNSIKYIESFTLGNTEAIKQIIMTGMGISCLSKLTVKREIFEKRLKGYRIRDINLTRKFNLVYHKDKNFSPLMKEFISRSRDTEI